MDVQTSPSFGCAGVSGSPRFPKTAGTWSLTFTVTGDPTVHSTLFQIQ